MGSLLKTIGYGVSFVVLLPFIIIALALYCVYCVLNYIVHEAVSIPRFFLGKKQDDDVIMQKLEEKKKEQRAYEDMKRAQVDAFQQNMFNNNANQNLNENNKEGEDYE